MERTHDELSIMLDQEEYDDISVAESLISETQRDTEQTVQVFSDSTFFYIPFTLANLSFSFFFSLSSIIRVRMYNDESSLYITCRFFRPVARACLEVP